MFWNAVAMRKDRILMRQKQLGIWREWTWAQAAETVREIGNGLLSLGFQPGDCASILANTLVEWVLADLAILSRAAGCATASTRPTRPRRCSTCARTRARVSCSSRTTSSSTRRSRCAASCRCCARSIVFDMEGLRDFSDPDVIEPGSTCANWAASMPKPIRRRWTQRVAGCKAEDLAILVYTSGTTGRPKGAMHSHGGLIYTVRGCNRLVSQDESDERMCFLPLCHIAERMGGEFFALYTGTVLNFVENPETVPENVREIAPTVFTAVPRVWEKFYSAVAIAIREVGPAPAD